MSAQSLCMQYSVNTHHIKMRMFFNKIKYMVINSFHSYELWRGNKSFKSHSVYQDQKQLLKKCWVFKYRKNSYLLQYETDDKSTVLWHNTHYSLILNIHLTKICTYGFKLTLVCFFVCCCSVQFEIFC